LIADFVCFDVRVFGALAIAAQERAIPDGLQARRLTRRMPVQSVG
jgi:hypothetical protein